MMKRDIFAIILMVLVWTAPVYAQDTFIIDRFGAYEFFVVVITGVVLAAAFQLMLTNLSAAAGLSATKVMVEKDEGKRPSGKDKVRPEKSTSDKIYSTLRKINTAYGLMTLVTASIALFAASWIAIELAGPPSILLAVLLALVIWGLAYLITFALEVAGVSTMVGALGGVARQSMGALTHSATQVMQRSEGRRQADQARAITDAVRSELFGHMDVQKQIQHYIQELKPDYGPRDYRQELESLLDELQIESFVSEDTAPGGMPEIIQKIRTSGAKMTREQAKEATGKIKSAFASVREEARSDKPQAEKTMDAAMRMAGMTREEAEENRRKLEDFLLRTDKAQLDPVGIKLDLETLFQDPRLGAESLRRRLSAIDRDTIETILAQRQDMSKEEIHGKVDKVWGVIESITGRMQQKSTEAREGARMETKGAGASIKEKALNRLEAYVDSLDRPNLDPEAIRHDFELLLHDPKTGLEDLFHRMKNLTREDVMAIVTSNRYISREDADRTVDRIMEIRDTMMERADQMKKEIQHRVDQIEQEARHHADQVRKTLASAAWWNFNTALGSGVAAGLGGLLAVIV